MHEERKFIAEYQIWRLFKYLQIRTSERLRKQQACIMMGPNKSIALLRVESKFHSKKGVVVRKSFQGGICSLPGRSRFTTAPRH